MPSPGHIASPAHPPHPARRAMIPHVISPRQDHVRPWAGWPGTGRRLPRPGQGGGSRRGWPPIGVAGLQALGS